MSNKTSNFPSNQLNNLPEEFCRQTVGDLSELQGQGRPKTLDELKARIDQYFEFCGNRGFRPGVEALCLSLNITRQTLWRWCNNEDCGEEWAECCRTAKQYILTFLEQATMKGKINPASSIFYLKNWADYKDNISFDEAIPTSSTKQALSAAELPKLGLHNAENDG